MDTLNTQHESISIKYNVQREEIEFLHTQVFLIKIEATRWRLGTRVFFKPRDTHALLHKTSYHPWHTFRGIVKSQLIWFNRICSRAEDVERATKILFKALRRQGYSHSFLRALKRETCETFDAGWGPWIRRNVKIIKKKIIPLITTFSGPSRKLNSVVKSNFSHVQGVMEPLSNFRVISAFKRNTNLKDLLVRATLKPENKINESIFQISKIYL